VAEGPAEGRHLGQQNPRLRSGRRHFG